MPAPRKRGSRSGSRRRRRSSSARSVYGRGKYTYSRPGPWGQGGAQVGKAVGSALGAILGASGATALMTATGGPIGGLSSAGISNIARAAGGAAGGFAGGKLGGLAHYVGRIFGSGAYKVGEAPNMNSLFTQMGSRLPYGDLSFGEKTLRFKHKEYLCDIVSSSTAGAFYNQTFPINPGMYQSFPFLSALAQNFQAYKMHGLVYEFKSMSADALNSTNTALGSVVAVVDYNAASGAFVSKQDMLNSLGAIDCKPSDCFVMGVECDPRKLPVSELYVRSFAVPTGQDQKFYDMGELNIASVGMQATSVNLGELHVIYDVELMLPILNNLGYDDDSCQIQYLTTNINTTNVFPDYSSTTPSINTTNVLSVNDQIGMEVGTNTNGSYVCFPPQCAGGIFEVCVMWLGASTALVTSPGIQALNLTLLSEVDNPVAAATSTQIFTKYVVQIPQLGAFNWKNTTFTTGGTHLGLGYPQLKFVATSNVLPASLTFSSLTIRRINPSVISTNFISTYANKW